MKLLEYKKELGLRWNLFRANLWFTFQTELAYAGNNWAGLASTTFYTVSLLIFLKILFSNIHELAGYSYQEMLFFFLMAQISYYLNWTLSLTNTYNLIRDVNQGNLDMVLVKPVPALFYLSTRNFNILFLLREGLAPTLAIVVAIKWGEIHMDPWNVLIGCVIMILGLWVLHVFQLVAALPVFWLGESEGVLDLANQLSSGNGVLIPFEGYSRKIQITFSSIMPILLTTAFASSAVLNKTSPLALLSWTFGMAVLALGIRKKMWNLAIKNYTSASS